jgi:hypothetical protein
LCRRVGAWRVVIAVVVLDVAVAAATNADGETPCTAEGELVLAVARQGYEVDETVAIDLLSNYRSKMAVFRSAFFALYKLIGDEASVAEYFERRKGIAGGSAAAAASAASSASDWRGAYFQINARHCLGTLGYRFDQDYTKAQLVKVTCGPPAVPIWVIRDEFMADPALGGSEKATRVKRMLNLSASEPLVEQLDDAFLLCRENDEEWEMVCKLDNVSRFVQQESVVCEFQWDASVFGRVLCRFPSDGDSATWQRFDESCEEFVEHRFGRNEVPGWAQYVIG